MVRQAGELINEGYHLLKQEEFKAALKVAKQLRKLRNTGGFEIGARALWGLDQRKEAIALLEEGVKKGPTVYPLWDYLGSYYSDEGFYAKALDAYRMASWCPDADNAATSYNVAIVYFHQKCFAEALSTVEKTKGLEGGPPPPAWNALHAHTLNSLGRYEEAICLAGSIPADEQIEDDWVESVSSLEAQIAWAVWALHKDEQLALRYAWSAIDRCKDTQEAATLICEIADLKTPTSRGARVIVHGRWHERIPGLEDPPGFYTTYGVIFDTEEEALEFIKPFEPEEVRASLTVDEIADVEPCPNELKGVVWAHPGYSFYEWER